MLATVLIVFREVLEAALIVGIVMAATKGVAGRGGWIGAGVGAGVLGAVLVALFADTIASAAEGVGQDLVNAAILLLAVAMLGWHCVWMGRHGREMAREMRAVGRDVAGGARPLYALAIVVGVAVMREGSETVLFLFGLAAADPATAASLVTGVALGIAAGCAVGLALYLGLLRIPAGRLFTVTTWMIVLLAAGMASQAMAFLISAGLVPTLGDAVWNSSALLRDGSVLGRVLHTLVGYTAKPAGIQVLAYLVTALTIAGLIRLVGSTPAPAARAVRA